MRGDSEGAKRRWPAFAAAGATVWTAFLSYAVYASTGSVLNAIVVGVAVGVLQIPIVYLIVQTNSSEFSLRQGRLFGAAIASQLVGLVLTGVLFSWLGAWSLVFAGTGWLVSIVIRWGFLHRTVPDKKPGSVDGSTRL